MTTESTKTDLLVAVTMVLVGLNLRGPVVSLPPLLPEIARDLEISESGAGLLTSVSLLCFGVGSPLVALAARRLGLDNLLLLSLALLAVGGALRPWGPFSVLLTGTLAVGIAITVGNVLVPVLARRDMERHAHGMVAVTTASYGVGAAAAAAFAVPLSTGLGWRAAAALIVGVPAALALLAASAKVRRVSPGPAMRSLRLPAGPVWREMDAWWLALYFGLQSAYFYSAATWLPAVVLEQAGTGEDDGGTALSVFLLVGVAGMLTVPLLLRWAGSAQRVAHASAGGWLMLIVGLLFEPEQWLLWVVAGGWAQGAGISLALTLIAIRPVDAEYGRGLSALVQGGGYVLGAMGPVVIGHIRALTTDWHAALLIGVVATPLLMTSGLFASREQPIGTRLSRGEAP